MTINTLDRKKRGDLGRYTGNGRDFLAQIGTSGRQIFWGEEVKKDMTADFF